MDPSKQSDGSGSWCWVGLPRAILINGRGNYFECEDVFKREVRGLYNEMGRTYICCEVKRNTKI